MRNLSILLAVLLIAVGCATSKTSILPDGTEVTEITEADKEAFQIIVPLLATYAPQVMEGIFTAIDSYEGAKDRREAELAAARFQMWMELADRVLQRVPESVLK